MSDEQLTYTFTPAIPDRLMKECNGNLNMAGMACRIAGFIKSGCNAVSIETICDIYGWSANSVRKYAKELEQAGILIMKSGTHRGCKTTWEKGAKFAGFFEEKGAKNAHERVQNLHNKGAKFAHKKENININNNINNNTTSAASAAIGCDKKIIKKKYNQLDLNTYPIGSVVSIDDYYKFYNTTLDLRGWQRIFIEEERRTIYKRITIE